MFDLRTYEVRSFPHVAARLLIACATGRLEFKERQGQGDTLVYLEDERYPGLYPPLLELKPRADAEAEDVQQLASFVTVVKQLNGWAGGMLPARPSLPLGAGGYALDIPEQPGDFIAVACMAAQWLVGRTVMWPEKPLHPQELGPMVYEELAGIMSIEEVLAAWE